ncbi:MAG: hypothetical protein EA392_00215, partial [Cryomorphaceae bacterium]
DNSSSSGAQFTSVQAAINAATAGDTLYIHPSPNSYGNITINKTLHLRSAGHSPQYTNGMSASIGNITLQALIGAPGITLAGLDFGNLNVSNNENYNNLEIRNCRFTKITASGMVGACDNWVIAGCVHVCNNFDSIHKQSSNGWMVINNHIHQPNTGTSWSIIRNFNASDIFRNNIIVSNQTGSAVVFQNCTGLSVENSILLFTNNASGIDFSGNTVTFNHSLTYHYPGLALAPLNGNNNLDNTNPMFEDIGSSPAFSSNKNFQLQAGSPGAGYGTDGQDIGLYGSDFPFNMYGYAPDIPFTTGIEILNSVVSPGGTLNVNFEASGN